MPPLYFLCTMRFLSADVIYPVTSGPLTNGVIAVEDNGIIADILSLDQYKDQDNELEKVEHFTGGLCPGFVNSHCHLELSYLKNQISTRTGMAGFIRQLLTKRNGFSEEVMQQSFVDAENEMIKNGIVAVGDISNLRHTLKLKQQGRLYYHTFVELTGLNAFDAGRILDKGISLRSDFKMVPRGNSSLSPHAPYSVSPKLFSLLKESCYVDDEPFTIHMQESIDEFDFIRNQTGSLAELFAASNFDYSGLPLYNTSPIKSILPQLPDCSRLMLVHNTYASKEDIQWSRSINKNIFWCLCPNANLYIEDRLPDIPSFVDEKAIITIGTDSLASNQALNVLSEINTIQKHFQEIGFNDLIRWATLNGALFLGIEKEYGSLEKGKKPGIINITKETIVSKIC